MDVPQFQRVEHPTARLTGQSLAMVALRAQIRHLARFDTVVSARIHQRRRRGFMRSWSSPE